MTMTAKDLFKQNNENTQRYIVPIYQRVFAWGDREVERLIGDLHGHFVDKSQAEDYYLGVITIVKDKAGNYVLVDGQQRITCLMLLGALLGWPMDYDRLDYECRPDDKKAKDSLKDGWRDGLSTGNLAMDNFFRCATRMKEKVDALKSQQVDVASHIRILVSELPENPYLFNLGEQNKYFEKMNAGGRQLEPHEILKVRICSQCLGGDGRLNQQSAFGIWNRAVDFSQSFKSLRTCQDDADQGTAGELDLNAVICAVTKGAKAEFEVPEEPKEGGAERFVNRESVVTLPMFLLHVLALSLEDNGWDSSWRDDKLLDAFMVEFGVETFIRNMEAYREFLDEHVIHLSYDRNQSTPSYVLGENEGDGRPEEDTMKIRQFQSMLFVADGGRQGKQRWLLELYAKHKAWRESASNDKPFGWLNVLKDLDKQSAPWVGSRKSMDCYIDSLSYKQQDRWLFWRLEYLLWEVLQNVKAPNLVLAIMDSNCVAEWDGGLKDRERQLIQQYQFHSGRSIEHLHPQTDDNAGDWNKPYDAANADGPRNKDMFGNLCLLTSSLNSALQNEAVGVKLARIKDLIDSRKIGLQSIKMLMMYKECQGMDVKWTWQTALHHVSRMKKVLQSSYLSDGAFQNGGPQSVLS